MERPELRIIMKERRVASGLTQRQVVEQLGCDLDTLIGLETGRKAPTNETLWRLGALYCLTLAELKSCFELAQHYRRNWRDYQHEYAERWARDFLKKRERQR